MKAPRAGQDAARAAPPSEEALRVLAEFAPALIWVTDTAGRCTFASRAWLEFTGRTLEQASGSLWMDRAHPDDLAHCHQAMEHHFPERQSFEIEYRALRADGRYRWLHARASPVVEDGRFEGFAGCCVDITDRLEADHEARRLELVRERAARAQAESANAARDQFLTIVSHELRSPLNGIKSWTHVLQNVLANPDPTVVRAIDGIMIGVEHQARLINDLLDVTRALSGNLGLAKQPTSLTAVLEQTTESLRALAAEKSLRLATDFGDAKLEIHADPDRIRQIFANLLDNAIKFTPHGGSVCISARAEGLMACVEVRDTGVGIAPEFLPYVFDAFRQGEHRGAQPRQAGLGLGLALVKRLAELHGGYVACESEGPGSGATFRVLIPLMHAASAQGTVSHVVHDAHAAPVLPSLTGTTVVVIDDQSEARESVATLLLQAGADVTACASAKDAIAAMEARGTGRPTVLVCDIAMPGEDGYAALGRIRGWEVERGTLRMPAIALSAFSQRQDRERALARGFQTYLTKPVAPAELIFVVANAARGMPV